MTPDELQSILLELKSLPTETEWVEFKLNDHGEAKYGEIGEYLSAISNSLAIVRRERGYIVWGINNITHELVGTDFRPRQARVGNEELENWLTRLLAPQIRFELHELDWDSRHFVVIEIAPATHTPVRFSGDEYIRVGSIKKRLKDHPEKERELWLRLSTSADWSAEVCPNATLDDLDPAAITFARKEYAQRNPHLADEVAGWPDATFLSKAKVCVDGRLTRAAIILLGRNEAEHHIAPGLAQLSWILKTQAGDSLDYRHFGPPLVLAVDQLFARVRNLTCRFLPYGTLFPVEVPQYDEWSLREILHNAIAHQDYSLRGRISVVESPEWLLFSNLGEFLPGTVEAAIRNDGPSQHYRNACLCQAMVNLGMIDTIGSGIRRVFAKQRQRNFPMPDYDVSSFAGRPELQVRVHGKVLDERYTRMLYARPDLDLWDAIGLDKVQKSKPLTDAEFSPLKDKKLIEGRRPKLFVSAEVAVATDTVEDYLAKRGIDKEYCRKMVIDLLKLRGTADRKRIESLLIEKLSDVLTLRQKRNVVMNLLQEMKREGIIHPTGYGRWVEWRMHKPPDEPPS
jgi:ATP-dependent DNA helicase RecG